MVAVAMVVAKVVVAQEAEMEVVAMVAVAMVVYDVVCARAGDSAKGRKAARDLARDALSDHLSDALETGCQRKLACDIASFTRRCELELFVRSTSEERPRKKAKLDPLTIIPEKNTSG